MKRGLLRNLILIGVWIAYPPFVLFAYFIAWLDRKLKLPLPFPRDVDQLAKWEAWCIKTLKEGGALPADAEVRGYKVTPITQALIFRSNAGIIEIGYSNSGERKTLKCFAKFAPTMGTVWNRTIFNIQMNHIKEGLFNGSFITVDPEVAAPKPYCSKISLLTGNLCLITEFMDGCFEYHESANEDFPTEHLEMVLDGMASLHARYWKDSSRRMQKVVPIHYSTVDLFDSLVIFSWSVPARKVLVKSWCLMNEHETVIHGDARIGNMMFPKQGGNGRFVFIDWQAVRKGKAVFDLAYFLVLSMTANYRRAKEQQAIDIYYNRLVSKGVKDYTKQQMEGDYRHACLCVLVLLSLPMLSGEASVEGDGALLFAYGMNIWRELLKIKFSDFDYAWMAREYDITEQEGRAAVEEMLRVIEVRLKGITGQAQKSKAGN